MKNKLVILAAVLILLLSVSACAAKPGNAGAGAVSLQDGLGRQITLEQPALRIVSLTPSVTEILFAIGAGTQVVGRDSFSNYPSEAADIQDVGGSMGVYSIETIVSLKPDLVIAAEINTPEQVSALENMNLKVYYLANPEDIEGIYAMIQEVGILSGRTKEAEALTSSLSKRADKVMKSAAKQEVIPLVFYELDGTDPAKPWTSGPGSFVDLLITKAGGKNVGAVLQSQWAQISIEELLVQDPDIILLGDAAYGVTPEQVSARPGWNGLTAVNEGRVYPFNDDLMSRPGPRLIDGLEELAKIFQAESQ